MKMKKIALATSLAVAALGAQQALAYEAGDIIVRAGLANVSPNDDSDGIAVPALGYAPLSGTKAEVDDDTQLGITATYMLSSSIGLELLAATPFSHDITANLGGGTKVNAGSTKHLPPTLSLVWYPLAGNGSNLQPYIGAGINYTIFFQEDVDSDVEDLAGALASAELEADIPSIPMELELDDSWGLAAQVGVDYALNEKWHINASVRWIDIDTEATFKAKGVLAKGTKVITVDDVEIDPYVYQINIGYKF